MPKRREGPRRDKKTGFYYFDEYVGLGQDKERIRFSLKTKDPDKARWRWDIIRSHSKSPFDQVEHQNS